MTEAEFLPLFDAYHDMVYRIALAATRSVPDAEDVTQSVFLKFLDDGTRPAPGKEKAWLARVAVNSCRDLMRSFWRRRTEPLDETIAFDSPEEGELFDAVMSLPSKYRVAVHLHYYEGYTHAEIGGMLGVGASAVSMRLHRARQLLRSKLKEDSYESLVSENI